MLSTGMSKELPLIVFADDWGRHPSSCQHLIRRMIGERPILWVNTVGTRKVCASKFTLRRGFEKLKKWSQGLQEADEQMWVIDVPMLPGFSSRRSRMVNRKLIAHRLRSVFKKLRLPSGVVLTTLPYTVWLTEEVPSQSLVYYCTDDYRHWPSADGPTLQQADHEITEQADLVLAASRALCESHHQAKRCEYFPHGVDYEHFASAATLDARLSPVFGLPGKKLAYFGLIYEKLDFELLTQLASSFPNDSLVMIGPVDYCPADFRKLPNVHFLGPIPYAQLPQVLSGADVLLLPYQASDDMIRQSGPLKMRECLATGKPTVSVNVPENRQFIPHVRIADDPADFVYQVRQAIQRASQEPPIDRQLAVLQDGWDQRAHSLRHYLSDLCICH